MKVMNAVLKLEINQLILRLAAAFHILFGLGMIAFPHSLFHLLKIPAPFYPEFWQGMGIFYLVFGIGYLVASHEPENHWLIVLVGFLAKLLITIGFFIPYFDGKFPLMMGSIILLTEVIWIIPFYFILMSAYDEHTQEVDFPKNWQDLVGYVRTSEGDTLLELSQSKNVLLVFVRQLGCLFCRENVTEMAKFNKIIEEKKLKLVFVHMADPAYADKFFSYYFSNPVAHISDPGRHFYRSMHLKRGSFYQLFGPWMWLKAAWVMVSKRIFQGKTEGDPLQLGGIFILSHGKIVYERRASDASTLFEVSSIPKV